MPLLKGRFLSPVKHVVDMKPNDIVYTISYTNERFLSKAEYDERLALYEDPIWTCQATGQIKLTHREAWDSEQDIIKLLKEDFPECWEKPVLDVVHHSTEPLDVLTDLAWRRIHEELHVGEEVTLTVGSTGKCVEGTIAKVDKSGVSSNTTDCSSPSSNKENSDEEGTKDDNRNSSRPRSPVKNHKKFVFPKLLHYKYGIKLKNEDKLVSGIPAADLCRVHRLPLKDTVKTFIRTFAWRGGFHQNSPWVVKEELARKYHLKNKLADIFLSPTKMSEIGRKVLEDKMKANTDKQTGKKRKRTQSQDSKKAVKKQKISSTPKIKSPQKKQTSPKKSPKETVNLVPSDSSSESEDSSDDDTPLSIIRNSPMKLTPLSTPKKSNSITTPSSTPRKRGRPSKAESEKIKIERELSAKIKEKKKKQKAKEKAKKLANIGAKKSSEKGTPKKSSPKKSNEQGTPKRGRPKKNPDEESPKKSSVRGRPRKLKQMTLFDMKGSKKDSHSSPKKPPSKLQKKIRFKMPPLAQRLIKAMDNNNKPVYFQLVSRCAKLLAISQIKQLPEKIREPILKRYNVIEEKKRLAKMTPEEKEEYMKQKKIEQKKKLNEMMKNRRIEQSRRFEDTDLELDDIPDPKLMETPDGIANELFGNVAMVTEFISCFKELLKPKDDTTVINVTTESLLNSLVSNSNGYGAVAHVLTTMLQTLLQDEIAEDYEELSMKMSEIPVNQYTASELVRLCLRKRDQNDSESGTGSEDSDELEDCFDLSDELIDRLESCEFYELDAEEKLNILVALCHRLMGSYSVQDYMEEQQRNLADLWKRRIAEQKERNVKKKGKKRMKKELKAKAASAKSDTTVNKTGVTLDSFYGKKEEESDDLASVVKRRHLMVGKMAEMKRQQEEEMKIRQEEDKKDKEFELLEKEFQDGISAAKWSYRQTPLGCDRNHNRYWLFHKSTPGLFVEKGWVCNSIHYSVKVVSDSDSTESCGELSSAESTQTPELKRGRPKNRQEIEKTFPHSGQNLWFMYDNLSDVDKLIEGLHPMGLRDSVLKAKLKEHYKTLTTTMQVLSKKQPVKIEPVDLVEGFRQELLDMENRLGAGGLGGVPNITAWEKNMKTAQTVQEFGQALIECQANIFEKFLKGVMVQKMKRPRIKTEKEEDSNINEDIKSEEEDMDAEESGDADMVAIGVEKWKETIESCTTFSKLHVLMGILDACIKWEKSAENAKCKICRKKGDEDKLLLCDQCNQAYHLYCLRPALIEIPPGEWFCPACVPSTKRVTRRKDESKDYRTLAGYGDSASSEETEEEVPQANELECVVCGGDEDIFPCSTCPSSFHLDCHAPPLRREPRSTWRCMQCTSGIQIRKPRRAVTKKKQSYCYDEDVDYYDKPTRSGRNSQRGMNDHYRMARKTSRDARKRPARYAEYESSESEDETPTRKSSRASPKSKKRYIESEQSDSESEEETPTRKSMRTSRRSVTHYEESESESESGIEVDDIHQKSQQSRKSRSTDRAPCTSKHPTGRKSHDQTTEKAVSPSSAHQTRRKGTTHLVNGEMIAQEIYDASQKIMMDVLRKLRRNKCAWPFMEPVTPKIVPDYHTIVKRPMDLQTIENKCISEQYKEPQQFVDDVTLMMNNSYLYNKPDSIVGKCNQPLEKYFCKLLQKHLPECTYPRMPQENKSFMNGTLSSENDHSPNTSQNGDALPAEILDHAYFTQKLSRH